MADTGPPWNLRFPGPQDFVRETNFYIEDLAEDTATALSAAGGLVAVKHVLKTDTFVASSVSSGAEVDVPDLEIEHEVADADNRLIITAYFGAAASANGRGAVGLQILEGSTLIGVGDAAGGGQPRLNAGGSTAGAGVSAAGNIVSTPSATFVHTPGTGVKTYKVRCVNLFSGTSTLFINRTDFDGNFPEEPRNASAFIIQEVKV